MDDIADRDAPRRTDYRRFFMQIRRVINASTEFADEERPRSHPCPKDMHS